MSESGPESGAAGHRRTDRPAGLPPIAADDQDDDQRSTTALPRPAAPPPFTSPHRSPAAQPTTALPRTPPDRGYRPTPPATGFRSGYPDVGPTDVQSPPARPTGSRNAGYAGAATERTGYSGAGQAGATPSAGAGDHGYQRLEPPGYSPPVGPSWAPQRPYPAEASRPPDYPADPYRRRQPPADAQHPPAPRADPPQERRYPIPREHRFQDDSGSADRRWTGDERDLGYPGQDGYADRGYTDLGYPARDDPQRGGNEAADFPTSSRRPAPRGSHLPPYSEPMAAGSTGQGPSQPTGMRTPRKLTVTRVAALRSRELTHRGVQMFHKATTADGADKSGLTSLTYAVMANYAVDAALAVALAGTLFFAAATGESTGRVLLYLVITVAPFAVIAPFIGPMLDRLQSGRRLALAVSSFGRALLALLMAFNFSHFNPWVIYPCALGNLVLSKAFGVLKAALTPRVLPAQITLVKTNSRLTTFGMIAGGVAGALAAGLSKIAGSPGALFLTAACAIAGGVLCLRIPAWVESTEGEVPVRGVGASTRKKGFPQIVTATLWANSMIRVETGFLALFIAFVVKSQYPAPQHSAFTQLLLLGVVGGAAGIGGFVGNTMGARLTLSAPETISIFALVSVLVATLVAVLVPGLTTAAIVGFVGSTASALAKVSLDSVIQHHLPEESRASAFGKSESVLQLGWVFGGVIGLLLGGVWTFGHANVYDIGFGTITLILAIGLVQSYLVRSGRTMVPRLVPRIGRRAGSGARGSRRGRRNSTNGQQDTDRLTRSAPASPAATAHLPAVEPESPRRPPRKAGGK